jgi:hypothetical protein
LTNNLAAQGGGAAFCTLNNCTVVGNSAQQFGGGAANCTLNNCIAFYNNATNSPNYASTQISFQNYCCTTPQPLEGYGNFTNAPLFVNQRSGDLRLQSNSPCINAGNNASAPGTTDLDDNGRIAGATVDIGAYEFQLPSSVLSYAWALRNGLATDGSADYTDSDGDGMNNWQEWICRTAPTDASSVLRLLAPVSVGRNLAVTWQSVPGVSYSIERSSEVAGTFTPFASDVPGRVGTTTFADTNAIGRAPFFYRVSVTHP